MNLVSIISVNNLIKETSQQQVIEQLIKLYRDVITNDPDCLNIVYDFIDETLITSYIDNINKHGLGFCYIKNNQIIGFIKGWRLDFKYNHILSNSTLLVAPKYQKSILGVGARLMKHFINEINNLSDIKLYEIKSVDYNVHFYEKLGLQVIYRNIYGLQLSDGNFQAVNTMVKYYN